ncbi:hypothetical protein [Salipiger bermudensis]|uniref:hypothetical protein n=1 Tax=Salipiger bermudensis TaxID=344736 RepID=UPI00300819BB
MRVLRAARGLGREFRHRFLQDGQVIEVEFKTGEGMRLDLLTCEVTYDGAPGRGGGQLAAQLDTLFDVDVVHGEADSSPRGPEF